MKTVGIVLSSKGRSLLLARHLLLAHGQEEGGHTPASFCRIVIWKESFRLFLTKIYGLGVAAGEGAGAGLLNFVSSTGKLSLISVNFRVEL